MFRLTMFPADDGDCLLLTYGHSAPYRHIVIDGGRGSAYPFLRKRLLEIKEAGEEVELLVLTHIDADHIEGILKLAKDPDLPLTPLRTWYNGYAQMEQIEPFGERQGDEYSALLDELEWPLNEEVHGGVISTDTLPKLIDMAGLKLTIVSPDTERLRVMRARWSAWRTAQAAAAEAREIKRQQGLQAMGRKPMPAVLDVDTLAAPTPKDPEPPNGSSIAFIAEWDGKRVLLTGDAHPDVLAKALAPLAQAEGGRVHIDLLKVSHHGSHGNTTQELVQLLDCSRFAISTSGNRHGHPDPQAIARLLKFSPGGEKTLYFNYRSERTTPWADKILEAQHNYRVVFPDAEGVVCIDI
jgi:beta-lactamase superfamily II metal-dependent hydrolase